MSAISKFGKSVWNDIQENKAIYLIGGGVTLALVIGGIALAALSGTHTIDITGFTDLAGRFSDETANFLQQHSYTIGLGMCAKGLLIGGTILLVGRKVNQYRKNREERLNVEHIRSDFENPENSLTHSDFKTWWNYLLQHKKIEEFPQEAKTAWANLEIFVGNEKEFEAEAWWPYTEREVLEIKEQNELEQFNRIKSAFENKNARKIMSTTWFSTWYSFLEKRKRTHEFPQEAAKEWGVRLIKVGKADEYKDKPWWPYSKEEVNQILSVRQTVNWKQYKARYGKEE